MELSPNTLRKISLRLTLNAHPLMRILHNLPDMRGVGFEPTNPYGTGSPITKESEPCAVDQAWQPPLPVYYGPFSIIEISSTFTLAFPRERRHLARIPTDGPSQNLSRPCGRLTSEAVFSFLGQPPSRCP